MGTHNLRMDTQEARKMSPSFAHFIASPRNFISVSNNGLIIDVTIATQRRSNVLHFAQHITNLRFFFDVLCLLELFLRVMPIGTIFTCYVYGTLLSRRPTCKPHWES